jgi:hypothetical protein
MEEHPEYLIEVFLAVTLTVTGIYLAGPWYVGGSTTAVGVLSDSLIGHTAIGLGYTAAGAVAIYGVAKNSVKARYWGTMALFGSYFFMTLLRLLTIGFAPIIWLLILCLAFISGLMHIIESRRMGRG